jgi:hypothetical protein
MAQMSWRKEKGRRATNHSDSTKMLQSHLQQFNRFDFFHRVDLSGGHYSFNKFDTYVSQEVNRIIRTAPVSRHFRAKMSPDGGEDGVLHKVETQ